MTLRARPVRPAARRGREAAQPGRQAARRPIGHWSALRFARPRTGPRRPAVRSRAGRDAGQATVELALVLPLVALLLLALVQAGLVARDQILVIHAAREAARAAAVSHEPDAARRAAERAAPLRARDLEVSVSGRGAAGSRVRVEVRYRASTHVPLAGLVLGDIQLRGSATMRVER